MEAKFDESFAWIGEGGPRFYTLTLRRLVFCSPILSCLALPPHAFTALPVHRGPTRFVVG